MSDLTPIGTAFRWNKRTAKAAQLVAEDTLSDEAIAAKVGIGKRTLERWKLVPEFEERVASIVHAAAEELRAEGIALLQNRVNAANDRWRRLQQVIEERAADARLARFPGGTTGLLALEPQLVKVYEGKGDPDAEDDEGETLFSAKCDRVVYVAKLDAALLKELRDLEKQVAQDTGQWGEIEDDAPADEAIPVDLAAVLKAEDTYLALAGRVTARVVRPLRPDQSSDAGDSPVPTLSLSGCVSEGPQPIEDRPQGAPDGDEPDGGAGGPA